MRKGGQLASRPAEVARARMAVGNILPGQAVGVAASWAWVVTRSDWIL